MARHLSIETIVEKNKISSENVFIILIDAEINDEDGNLVQHLRFCKNTENITWDGNEYQAANFDITINNEVNQEPRITMTAQDQTRTLGQFIEAYAGVVGSKVTMTIVNSGNLSAPAELQEEFKIISSSMQDYVVSFDLGIESAVNRRFPLYRQFKDRCPWKYKGSKCGYSGPLPKCDYTLMGPNGCAVHNNINNFGGFSGLNTMGN